MWVCIIKKLIIILIAMIACIGFVGCSLDPVYYSKRDVMNYAEKIFGNDIELIEELEYEDDQEESNLMYEYVFQDDSGLEFSVYNYTTHTYLTGNQTIFYQKNIDSDYLLKMVSYKEEDLLPLLDHSNFDYKFEDGYITLYLESYLDLEEASTLLEDIDRLLSFEYDLEAWDEYAHNYGLHYRVSLKIKPNYGEEADWENWKENFDLFLISATMSYDADNRKSAEDYFTSAERTFVYKVRDSSKSDYLIPDELLYKYPAEYLSFTNDFSNEENFRYGLTYDIDSDKYWCGFLDPCQEWNEAYNYTNRGSFKHLVESLDGTYESNEWKATWHIGGSKFQAELIVDKDSYYRDFILYKDGEKVDLDIDPDIGNGTVSGRAFSVKDLEQMLNVTISIDNRGETATIAINPVSP